MVVNFYITVGYDRIDIYGPGHKQMNSDDLSKLQKLYPKCLKDFITMHSFMQLVVYTLLFSTLIATIFISTQPKFEGIVQKQFFMNNKERQVLSVVSANILSNGESYQIVKILEYGHLWLEVYKRNIINITENTTKYDFISRTPLPYPNDGCVWIQDQCTNLALKNIDQDAQLEILTTSFNHMHGYLHTYKLDPVAGLIAITN